MCKKTDKENQSAGHESVAPSKVARAVNMSAYPLADYPFLAFEFMRHLVLFAWQGQMLPRLTLLFVIQAITHSFLVSSLAKHVSNGLLRFNAVLLFGGHALLIALYRHSIMNIFNSRVPKRALPSFLTHLALLRPLEIIFRYVTQKIRVLPDIIILGEVRCGTTTLCQHLASINGLHEPFCLWRHPELDRKETFYFVGHYLGNVHPHSYAMCFPLAITRFWHRRILRRPFFTFDGCAQYLSSPTAPYLIAKAYKEARQAPPVLVACVRDPVAQTVSWWNYENNAMLWGRSMGLKEWNSETRTKSYPPQTISSALSFSYSTATQKLYNDADSLFSGENKSSPFTLPDWAMTWPGGQLSGIGRNGMFASNIRRYERVFLQEFGEPKSAPSIPESSRLKYVNVIPLKQIIQNDCLLWTLRSLVKQMNRRSVDSPILNLESVQASDDVHRNKSVPISNPSLKETSFDETSLRDIFLSDTQALEEMCGTSFGWTTSVN